MAGGPDEMGHVVIGFAAALLVAVAGMAIGLLSPHDILAWDLTWRNGVLCALALAFAFSAASSFFVRGAIATQYALVIACIFIGFLSALLLREGLLSGVIDYRLAGFALWLALLTAALWWTQVVDFWNGRQLGMSAFLISFVATLVLGTYPAFAWNTLIAAQLNLRTLIVDGAPPSATATGLYELLSRGEFAIGLANFLLAGAAASLAYYARPVLKVIHSYVQLSDKEISEAKKWRRPAREAISKFERLDTLYPHRLNIETWQPPPELVFESQPTIIRIYIPPSTTLPPSSPGEERVRNLRNLFDSRGYLDRRGRDLDQSLIILYQLRARLDETVDAPPPRIVGYGLGSEFRELFYDAEFLESLNTGDTMGITQAVDGHRSSLLGLQPDGSGVPRENDVLLGTRSEHAATSLRDVLEVMGQMRYRRILLCGDKEPYAFGILSADKIARFISAQ